MIRLFNTLGRRKQDFVPIKAGHVGIYSCGPTVYDYAHIGNLSTFLFVDFLRRWLEFRGLKVTHVMNLTDVDDKTIRRSRNEGVPLRELTNRYSEAFFADLKKLGIQPAHVYPRATEHVPEMVALIKSLLGKGCAYEKGGSVYFRISSFPRYGRLALLDQRKMLLGASGVDADEYEKEDARDFVLWKGWKPDEDGDVFWDTEIGRGRPGWHIECSAMSMKYLGQTFDIHTGGVDLIFPHHENEIAQSESASGQKFVNFWLHREHLRFGGEKMSKSLGTIKSLGDIVATPSDAAAFRYLIFSSHYRMPLNFTIEALTAAKRTVKHLRDFRSMLLAAGNGGMGGTDSLVEDARQRFIAEMDDDLGSPGALAALFELMETVGKLRSQDRLSVSLATAVSAFLDEVDCVIGVINQDDGGEEELRLTPAQQELIREREAARSRKDWNRADEIRDELFRQGIKLEDTTAGTKSASV